MERNTDLLTQFRLRKPELEAPGSYETSQGVDAVVVTIPILCGGYCVLFHGWSLIYAARSIKIDMNQRRCKSDPGVVTQQY
jgi:hypothetical protein